jgi:hypothetical protein
MYLLVGAGTKNNHKHVSAYGIFECINILVICVLYSQKVLICKSLRRISSTSAPNSSAPIRASLTRISVLLILLQQLIPKIFIHNLPQFVCYFSSMLGIFLLQSDRGHDLNLPTLVNFLGTRMRPDAVKIA